MPLHVTCEEEDFDRLVRALGALIKHFPNLLFSVAILYVLGKALCIQRLVGTYGAGENFGVVQVVGEVVPGQISISDALKKGNFQIERFWKRVFTLNAQPFTEQE